MMFQGFRVFNGFGKLSIKLLQVFATDPSIVSISEQNLCLVLFCLTLIVMLSFMLCPDLLPKP